MWTSARRRASHPWQLLCRRAISMRITVLPTLQLLRTARENDALAFGGIGTMKILRAKQSIPITHSRVDLHRLSQIRVPGPTVLSVPKSFWPVARLSAPTNKKSAFWIALKRRKEFRSISYLKGHIQARRALDLSITEPRLKLVRFM